MYQVRNYHSNNLLLKKMTYRETMFSLTLLLGVFASGVFAGSVCPSREDIYPCSCLNIPQSKKSTITSVFCHHLESTDSLMSIFSSLRFMQIDIFHLYDSFWAMDKLGDAGLKKKMLPTDWLTLLKIKEIEIVDTKLADCFACNSKLNCRNSIIQRFTAVNSSSHNKICALCDTGRGNQYSWITCMNRLRHFHFSHAKIATLDSDLFIGQMRELTILNLTHNEISIIKPNAFKNVPRLKILDLSHNLIEYLENVFTVKMQLELLDVSYNSIQTLGDNFFKNLPDLKVFNADDNRIVNLKESEWKDLPASLKTIQLEGNQLHCDCDIQWLNTTLHVNVVISGECLTPDDFEGMPIRRASKNLNERCVGSSIGTRPKSATESMLHLSKIE